MATSVSINLATTFGAPTKTLTVKDTAAAQLAVSAAHKTFSLKLRRHSLSNVGQHTVIRERQLGDTEVSYFLPSREDGVNDMYLHLGFQAPPDRVRCRRVTLAWGIMRIRHPLLASTVEMKGYDDIRFVYEAPHWPNGVIASAGENISFREESKDDIINAYLNGPRTLSNDRLAHLIMSTNNKAPEEHDMLICASHFIGDGMALHQCANDFLSLLGGPLDDEDLHKKLIDEWLERCFLAGDSYSAIPLPVEDRLPAMTGRFKKVMAGVDYYLNQKKAIGGHAFPKKRNGPRHTVIPTISLERERTKRILASCKRHDVSISAAMFAICNIAWARTTQSGWDLPMMMYSAMNMRSSLAKNKQLNDSYWFLSIGYFNIVLPSFCPSPEESESTFWHRARSAKQQSTKAIESPWLTSRCRLMANERAARSRVFAKMDDEKASGAVPQSTIPTTSPTTPSVALMGLSLLGNLDGIYKHSTFPDIKLHTLTTGSRQRAGGMLLFLYTFVGKLWISFGYDRNGFEEETVEKFWQNVLQAVDEFF